MVCNQEVVAAFVYFVIKNIMFRIFKVSIQAVKVVAMQVAL